LLDRFTFHQDQVAFSDLVSRHGPMVMAVCHRVLRHSQDAEDAFQATFLVLARKACTLQQPELVSNWLYGVAYRTAQHARSRAAQRRQRESEAASMTPVPSEPDPHNDDLIGALDNALHSLPDKYRAPLVLCYLEGKTNLEAARLLGIPAGSMSSRLARGRELLRERLAGRWVSDTTGAVQPVLGAAGPAAVPTKLATTTAQAALGLVGGQPISDLSVSEAVKELVKATLESLGPPQAPRWLLAAWVVVWVVAAFGPWSIHFEPGPGDPKQPISLGPPAGAGCHYRPPN
jgi:RNA polymerase sigma factor (sigma-70 family)